MSRSFPSSRGSTICPWYSVGKKKKSDKNLEQRKNIKFSVKIGKIASETLALLTLAYGEYVVKKWKVLECHRRFKEVREDVQDDPRSGQPKMRRADANVDRVRTLVSSDRRFGMRLIEEKGYGNLFGGKTLNSGLRSGFSTTTMPLHIMRQGFPSSWLRNPLQKLNHPPYSHDLARCDFWLFPKLKNCLEGTKIC
jgi:hypothetical protein